MSCHFGQQESEQRCGGSQVLIAWPGGLRCWYGFSASFVPECDATCVVGRQLLCLYKTQPQLKGNSEAEMEFTEALLLPELRHQCS